MRCLQLGAPAIGAAGEIVMLRSGSVEGQDEGPGLDCHFVDSAITKVSDFLRMTESPASGCRSARMAGIGGGGSITNSDGGSQVGILNASGKCAIACTLILT